MAFFDQIEKIKASMLAKVNASVSGDQVQVWASQDALKGHGQEHPSTAGDVCAI